MSMKSQAELDLETLSLYLKSLGTSNVSFQKSIFLKKQMHFRCEDCCLHGPIEQSSLQPQC